MNAIISDDIPVANVEYISNENVEYIPIANIVDMPDYHRKVISYLYTDKRRIFKKYEMSMLFVHPELVGINKFRSYIYVEDNDEIDENSLIENLLHNGYPENIELYISTSYNPSSNIPGAQYKYFIEWKDSLLANSPRYEKINSRWKINPNVIERGFSYIIDYLFRNS